MTTIPHGPPLAERRSWIDARDLWASLAIAVIWLAVLFSAAFGSDIKAFDAGGSNSTIPSAVGVALFAALATWPVAKYGFTRKREN